MKTIFKKSLTNWGCYAPTNKQDTIWHNEDYTIDDILNADIPLKDKGWFIRHNCELTPDQFREFAIGCALCVLPIYEAKYPDNKAPREAIEAAKAYLSGEIGIDVLRAKRAAAAAYAAAAAAYAAAAAAYAAAYAAYAAAYAAYAAAYAAYAAAAYAAAAYAAAKTDYRDLLLQFFKEFTAIKETV